MEEDGNRRCIDDMEGQGQWRCNNDDGRELLEANGRVKSDEDQGRLTATLDSERRAGTKLQGHGCERPSGPDD